VKKFYFVCFLLKYLQLPKFCEKKIDFTQKVKLAFFLQKIVFSQKLDFRRK
jgi:hypothetical protein